MLLLLSPSSLLLLVLWPSSVESGLRCGFLNNIPFLGATNDRACRASCVVQGQTTGQSGQERGGGKDNFPTNIASVHLVMGSSNNARAVVKIVKKKRNP